MVPLLQSQLFAARARTRAGRERVAATDSIARSMIKPSLTILTVPDFNSWASVRAPQYKQNCP